MLHYACLRCLCACNISANRDEINDGLPMKTDNNYEIPVRKILVFGRTPVAESTKYRNNIYFENCELQCYQIVA